MVIDTDVTDETFALHSRRANYQEGTVVFSSSRCNKTMSAVYTVVKALGGSLWKWEDGVTKAFTVIGPIRIGKTISNPRNGLSKAADIMSVKDLADGFAKEVLVGAVLKSSLVENYQDDSYVGRSFTATQGAVAAGKRYKAMEVAEIDPTATE